MSRYSYVAILETGQRVNGTLQARDRHDALRQLLHRGCHPLSVMTDANSHAQGRRFIGEILHRISRSDLAVFTRQLSSLLKAGLPLIQALTTLRHQCGNPRLVHILQDVEEKLTRDGGTFAEALEDYPHTFSAVYRGLVHSGEEGGNLVPTLGDLAKHLGQSAKLRRQVWGAFIYPIFLLILGSTAVFVLMAFVIPRFQELFASFGGRLPTPTRILIAVSDFLASWWWTVLLGLSVGILLVFASLRNIAVREKIDRSILRIPVLGPMLCKLETAQIAHTLAVLLNSGIPILEALRITGATVKNLAFRVTFNFVVHDVSTGEGLAPAMAKSGIYPSLVINLIRTGEETGELPEMLEELSDIYEDEAERAVTGAVKLLEPVLICVMGGVIAGIVAAVILPIFRTNIMTG